MAQIVLASDSLWEEVKNEISGQTRAATRTTQVAELGYSIDLFDCRVNPWCNCSLRNWQKPLGCLLPNF